MLDGSAVERLNEVTTKRCKHNQDSFDVGNLQQVSNQAGQPVIDRGILLEEQIQPFHVVQQYSCSPGETSKSLIFVGEENHIHIVQSEEFSELLVLVPLLVGVLWGHKLKHHIQCLASK